MGKNTGNTAGRLIALLIKDPDRKPLYVIMAELIYLTFYYRRLPRHYFSRYLFKKARENITDYYPDRILYKVRASFNDQETREILENKLFFNYYFGRFDLCLPKILMYNTRNVFVTEDEAINIKSLADFKQLLTDTIRKNSKDGSIFIKKTSWSYGGDKIFKVFLKDLETNSQLIEELFYITLGSEYLFQETVKQHEEMAKLNPSCLNTIRIDTFMDKFGKVEVLSAYLRTSIRNLCVDNISAGGCRIAIDLESGKLRGEGFSSLKQHGVDLLPKHPHTNIEFDGFRIPFFPDVKEMVIKAASSVPSIRSVGWDVAIGEFSPVLIEGNSLYNMPGNDLTYGGYRKNPVFRKMLAEYRSRN